MKKIFIIQCIFLTLFTTLFADIKIEKDIKLTPSENIQQFKNKPNNLDPDDYMMAALIASGIPESSLSTYMSKAEEIYKNFLSYNKKNGNSEAEKALVYLYDKKVLKTYSANQTLMNVLFDDGIYNCVSSVVLYSYILKKINFAVSAMQVDDHVFVTVKDARGRKYNVETTSKLGYNPGSKKNITIESSGKTGTAVMEQVNYNDKNLHDVSGRRLISSIFFNRIAYEQEKENPDLELMLQLAVDAVELQYDNSSEIKKDKKETLQDFFTTAGSVMGYLITQEKSESALYVAKSITDTYCKKYGTSKYVYENADIAFRKCYVDNADNFHYLENLFKTYGSILSKEAYDKYAEDYLVRKIQDLVWNDNYEEAKRILINGIKSYPQNEILQEYVNQFKEADLL